MSSGVRFCPNFFFGFPRSAFTPYTAIGRSLSCPPPAVSMLMPPISTGPASGLLMKDCSAVFFTIGVNVWLIDPAPPAAAERALAEPASVPPPNAGARTPAPVARLPVAAGAAAAKLDANPLGTVSPAPTNELPPAAAPAAGAAAVVMPRLAPIALAPAAMVLPTADNAPVIPPPEAAVINPATPTLAMPAVKTTAAAMAIAFQFFLTNFTAPFTNFFTALISCSPASNTFRQYGSCRPFDTSDQSFPTDRLGSRPCQSAPPCAPCTTP